MYVSPRKDQVLSGNHLSKHWLSEQELEVVLNSKRAIHVSWFTYMDRIDDSAAWEKIGTSTSQITIEEADRGEEDLISPKRVNLSDFIPKFKNDDVAVDDLIKFPKHLHRLFEFVEENGDADFAVVELDGKYVGRWQELEADMNVSKDSIKHNTEFGGIQTRKSTNTASKPYKVGRK